jgi:hypothetical protein
MRFLLACAFLFAISAAAQKQIAITLDDLPVATYSQNPAPEAIAAQQEITRSVLASLQKHHVPAIGFMRRCCNPGWTQAWSWAATATRIFI